MNNPTNPWSAVGWNLTAQGQIVKRYGLATAQRMAKAEGSSIGGLKPRLYEKPKIYIIKGRPGRDGRDAAIHEYLGFFAAGPFNADQYFTLAAAEAQVTFPSVLSPDKSKAQCGTAPTVTSSFYLVRDVNSFLADGSTLIATGTFNAGETIGSITYNGTNVVTIDTALFVVCPHDPDATILDVQLTFSGDPA